MAEPKDISEFPRSKMPLELTPELMEKIKNEVLRRSGYLVDSDGKIMTDNYDQPVKTKYGYIIGKIVENYLSNDYKLDEGAAENQKIISEHGQTMVNKLLEIADFHRMGGKRLTKYPEDYDNIPVGFDEESMTNMINHLASESYYESNSSCRSYCTGLCVGSCGVGCSNDCASECAMCTGQCTSGCSTQCGDSCRGTCQGTCDKTCNNMCVSTCVGSCKLTCNTVCTTKCLGGCSTTCTGKCTGCSDSCKGECKGGCTGSTGQPSSTCGCGSTCSTGCSTTCTANCAGGCGSGCTGACTTTCDGSATTSDISIEDSKVDTRTVNNKSSSGSYF